MARTKTVFGTSEIPHLWAHQTQSEARNQQGNLYFRGDTIYSYRDSFPIGRHVTNSRGEKAVLISSNKYSVTTASHISAVVHSLPHGTQVFYVNQHSMKEHGSDPYSTSVSDYVEEITGLLLKAKRAKANKDWDVKQASDKRSEALAFAAFYDLDASSIPAMDYDVTALEASIRSAKAQERKEAKERQTRRLIEQADAISAWRSGTLSGYPGAFYDVPTMLRVNGDLVETSRGVSFPISHARKALALVRAVMARGEDWRTNGHTCYLGHYRLDRITKQGTVYAGCHVVTWPEIEHIAPLLETA